MIGDIVITGLGSSRSLAFFVPSALVNVVSTECCVDNLFRISTRLFVSIVRLTMVCPLKYFPTLQPEPLRNWEAGVPHLLGSGFPDLISAGMLWRLNQ